MNGKEIVNLEAEIHGITEAAGRERFFLDVSEDVLLRIFCTARAGKVILLLHGYDKGTRPSKRHQQAEIAEATRRLKLVEQRDAAARKETRRTGRGRKP